MAEALSCPVCLDLLKEPVTIPCGHSYCMTCLQTHWDHQETYTCPECRRSFSQRPVLGKNIMLAALVEQLQRKASPACDQRNRGADLQTKRSLLLRNLQDKEIEVERLHQEAQDIRHSAQTTMQRSRIMFRELAVLLEKRRTEVEQQIQLELESRLRHVQELQDLLRQDVTELRKSISELDEPSDILDHSQLTPRTPQLSTDINWAKSREESRFDTILWRDFEFVSGALSNLKEKMQLILSEFKLSPPEDSPAASPLPAEPVTRDDFLKYSCEITLDPNTAFTHLSLYDENTKVTYTSEAQSYPSHGERFSVWSQVLSREELTGRCYFEVEWSVRDMVRIAVSYRDIRRKGYSDECGFGNNCKSWALQRLKNELSFWFDGVQCEVSGPVASRIGVFLDQDRSLSFYSIQDQTLRLLHRVQARFTQPLHVGVLIVWERNTVHFPKLK